MSTFITNLYAIMTKSLTAIHVPPFGPISSGPRAKRAHEMFSNFKHWAWLSIMTARVDKYKQLFSANARPYSRQHMAVRGTTNTFG